LRRVERYDDEDGVILNTGLGSAGAYVPFQATGASIGLDVTPHAKLLWRTELRGFWAGDEIFPDRDNGAASLSKSGAFVVSSMALTF
jgi:hypothetical protein